MVQNKKRIISLILMLTLLVSSLVIGAITASAAEETATLSFANKEQRTEFSTSKQVWEKNGVTLTNNKASSSNAVADYANPVRLYAGSNIVIEAPGNITKIEFTCNGSYASALKSSIGDEATVSGKVVTLTLATPAESYTIAKLTGQVRLDSMTVYYEEPSGCEHENTTTNSEAATCTTPGSETVTCNDCGDLVSSTTFPALGHEYKSDVCSRCGNIKPSTTTVTVTIGDYASANNWQNGTKYTSVKIDENITVTANGEGNTGKYYTSGSNWRIYQSENGTFQIKAANEIIIVSVKISYNLSDGGQLTYNNSGYTTGSEIVIGKNSAVFGVANTRGETNGQVRITSIEVVYCDHNNAKVTTTATCTTSGQETIVCGCGYTTSKDVSATGHSFTNYVSNGDATCTANGTETAKCDNCDATDTKTAVDSKLDHSETCGHEAVIKGVGYETLQAALNAAVNGDTVVLLKSITVSKYLDIKTANNGEVPRDFTLDLNGHTISPASDYSYNTGYPLVFVGINQTLTIKGEGTITAEMMVTIGAYGVLNIVGGTVINNGTTDKDAAIASYYWNHDLPSYEGIVGGTVAITGGNFVGAIHCDEADKDGRATLTISGGSFNTDVSEYCAHDVDCKLDGNGSYGIVEHVHIVGCGHYAVEGDTLANALAANDKVVLTKPVSVGALAIPDGKILDLNGQTLTAGGVVSFGDGHIIDSAASYAKGKLYTSNIQLSAGNYPMVPVLVAENTYVFSTVKNQNDCVEAGTAIFRPSLSNSGLSNQVLFGANMSNLKFGIVVSRVPVETPDAKPEYSTVIYIPEAKVIAVYGPNAENNIVAFTITLTNMSDAYIYGVEVVLCHGTIVVYQAPIAILPKKEEK